MSLSCTKIGGTYMEVNKVEETIKKAQDWWGEHNFGTRITLMTLLILTTITVLVPILTPVAVVTLNGLETVVPRTIPHYESIISLIIQATAWAFVVVTVGPNTIGKVAEAWMQFRSGKNV